MRDQRNEKGVAQKERKLVVEKGYIAKADKAYASLSWNNHGAWYRNTKHSCERYVFERCMITFFWFSFSSFSLRVITVLYMESSTLHTYPFKHDAASMVNRWCIIISLKHNLQRRKKWTVCEVSSFRSCLYE